MKKSLSLLIAAVACTCSHLAAAVPIYATFNGTVAGSSGFSSHVLNDFPVGTSASFDVTFDDSGLVADAAAVTDFDLAPVSGWVRLGSQEWLLDAGRIWTYSFLSGPGNPVISYGLQLTGTGPTISDNASIFGLFLSLTPNGAPNASAAPLVGFAYPVSNGEFYSYANLAGTFATSRERTAVPEPNTGLLMCGALALLACLHRSRRRRFRAS